MKKDLKGNIDYGPEGVSNREIRNLKNHKRESK